MEDAANYFTETTDARQLLRDKSVTIQICTDLKLSLMRPFGMNLINGDDQLRSV